MHSIVIIDHCDSFTCNIKVWLQEASPATEVQIVSYDDVKALTELRRHPVPLVLSAGPHSPAEAMPTLELLADLKGIVPIMGICLGLQIICAFLGIKIEKSQRPLHGKLRRIFTLSRSGMLRDMPASFLAPAYNSLAAKSLSTLPTSWQVAAVSAEDEIQVIEYLHDPPICGLQFHPESFLDQYSLPILQRWLEFSYRQQVSLPSSLPTP